MSITRSQIARELMAEGGAPRQGYFLGKIVRKIKDDIIPNELKSPAGLAAAALAVDQFGIPGTDIGGGKNVSGFLGSIFDNIPDSVKEGAKNVVLGKEVTIGPDGKPILTPGTTQRQGGLLGALLSPAGLSIGTGLLAGAFAKDKDDPLYTGQSVGLNLRDIRKLANISDPRTGAAIGLNFLPETRFRQFTPEQMAETYATTTPVDFTEQRESAEEGGIMGNQEDFNKFLEDMKKREYGRIREQILKDYEEFMRRKRMINQRPEVKDGGIMEQFKMASAPDPAAERNDFLEMMSEKYYKKPLKDLTPDEFMDLEEALDDMGMKPMPKGRTMAAGGGLMNLGGMEMDLRGGGFVPIGAKERADDVPARLSKNEFVFTADAVRAAGGGSVDKGADKMYATMKALENKVA